MFLLMMIYFWVSIHPAKLLKASLRENKEQTVTQKPDHELGLYQSGHNSPSPSWLWHLPYKQAKPWFESRRGDKNSIGSSYLLNLQLNWWSVGLMVGGCWFESNQICQRTTRYKVYMRKVAQWQSKSIMFTTRYTQRLFLLILGTLGCRFESCLSA